MKRYVAISTALVLAACGGLPRSLRNEIAQEKERLQQAERQLKHSEETVREDIAHSPDLFRGTPVVSAWPAKLQSAHGTLDRANGDLEQLDKFSGRDQARADRLLRDERSLRESALHDSEAVEEDANRWLDFQKNVPHYLAEMQREYDQVRAADLDPVTQSVTKAEQDWPAKKGVLDSRLTTLRQSSEAAETEWRTTETARQDAMAGMATGAEIATLIQANETLAADARNLTTGANELKAQSAQLYDAWDKILVDLDTSHRGFDTVYSEKIKTVHTKKGEVTSDERWVDVSPSAYHAVDNDLGMAIAHKDAGLFDSEAQTTAQPPGFAYIASPSQGSNQYGYWTHSGGQSFWTFLPQYLIMRELLWGHHYQPIYINEYYGYSTALRSGRTYYGNETPAAPPKYGSRGTFTQQGYAGSRYVQSGGFKGSAYSSNRTAEPYSSPKSFRPEPNESPAGKRFGSNSGGREFGSSSAGKRFGSGSAGKGFGSTPRSMPRMPGKSFGRRR
jgi:hypothetical protein